MKRTALLTSCALLLSQQAIASNIPANVPQVGSIAALQALTTAQYTPIYVSGAQAGTFLYSGSSCDNSGSGDAGTQFPATGVGSGCWKRQYAGPFHTEWFTGSDIGAQINKAISAYGYLGSNQAGEVDMPCGKFNISTQVVASYGGQQPWIKGCGRGNAGGTLLTWTGSSTPTGVFDFVTAGQAGSAPLNTGKLSDFTLLGANLSSDCTNGIVIGNVNGTVIRDVEVDDFQGTTGGGCSVAAAGLVASLSGGGQLEAYDIDIAVVDDTNGAYLSGGGNASYEHGTFNIYYVGGGDALLLASDAFLARGVLTINGNLIATGATEIALTGTSSLLNEEIHLFAEDDASGTHTFNTTSGTSCQITANSVVWTDSGAITSAGQGCSNYGDKDGAGDFLSNTVQTNGVIFAGTSFGSPSTVSITGGTGAQSFPSTSAGGVQDVLVICNAGGGNFFSERVVYGQNTGAATPYGVSNFGTTPTRTYSAPGNTLELSLSGSAVWSCTATPMN